MDIRFDGVLNALNQRREQSFHKVDHQIDHPIHHRTERVDDAVHRRLYDGYCRGDEVGYRLQPFLDQVRQQKQNAAGRHPDQEVEDHVGDVADGAQGIEEARSLAHSGVLDGRRYRG
ncbi:hypothetical protein DSECCO2_454010 [anaerobic digester metagenome]